MFYLTLSKRSDPAPQRIFRFFQRDITIGKDLSNNLRLYSPDKLISSIHAEIYTDMDNFFIVDKGSNTGTFIENIKLVRNRSYLLSDGTQVKIGEYRLTFLLNSPDKHVDNWKKNSVNNLINYLNDSVTYLHNIKTDNPELYDQNIKAKLTKILNFNENSILKSLLGQDGEERNGNDKPAAPDSNKLDFIVDMFLKLFVEFHAMSIHISKEFVDSHTVHRRDSQKLVFPDSLKNYILNSDLSSEEKEQRIKLLWNEIEELILNHIALFAGYKSSIKYGTRDLLKELDPVSIINGEQRKSGQYRSIKIINKCFPFVMEHKHIKSIKEKYQSLSSKMGREIESKYFQPAFKSGYLQKVNSVRDSNKDLKN